MINGVIGFGHHGQNLDAFADLLHRACGHRAPGEVAVVIRGTGCAAAEAALPRWNVYREILDGAQGVTVTYAPS